LNFCKPIGFFVEIAFLQFYLTGGRVVKEWVDDAKSTISTTILVQTVEKPSLPCATSNECRESSNLTSRRTSAKKERGREREKIGGPKQLKEECSNKHEKEKYTNVKL
jgi:hypothetical protein